MAKALYRKYRPSKLSEVVGQSQVTDILDKAIKEKKISHAYLFVGPRGTGKTSVARIFAHEINNFEYTLEDDYVDIVEIDGASNRGIDNIRELREKAAIAPTEGKYKVYIIDEVHMLTKEAFNALLKTLEEPPAHVIFIMATTDAHKVPVTITSRSQTYTFHLVDIKTMREFLRSVAEKEKISIQDDAIKIIAKRGGGSFRDSLSLLDQLSALSEGEITKEQVIAAMGLPEDEKVQLLLQAYVAGDLVAITKTLRELAESGTRFEAIIEETIRQIIAQPRVELLPLLDKLTNIKAPFVEAKLLVALSEQLLHSSIPVANATAKIPSTQEQKKTPTKTAVAPGKNIVDDSVTTREPYETMQEKVANGQHAVESFDWEEYLQKVRGLSDAIYSQLIKTQHEFANNVLDIYPTKKIVRTILVRDNNKKILLDAAGTIRVVIHEVDEVRNKTNDVMIDKISDIMGGEVEKDGGDNPFK